MFLQNLRKQQVSRARSEISFRLNGENKIKIRWRQTCEIWYRGHHSVSTMFNYMPTITNMTKMQHFQFVSDKFNVVESVVTEIILATGR